MDKKKYKKLNSKIINSITPFLNISYNKEKEIDVFVGREKYLRSLTEILCSSVFSERSYGVSISGPGGCGKSTLFGYFMQLINSGELYHQNYCQLQRNESEIITCFIDAPKGETTTLKYFWSSIIDSLAEENMEFLDKFATNLFRKCLDVLWVNDFKREELKSFLIKVIPDFENVINHHRIIELLDVNKFYNYLISDEEFVPQLKKLIMQGWRILQRHEVHFGIMGVVGEFDQRRIFKIEKQYFDLFFDMLSPDFSKCQQAHDTFKGGSGDLINSDSDVIKIFNWLTNTWEWIEEKPISFLIGVDNIGYLTVDIEDKSSAYIPFIQTILQMRDALKKFLFVLIGTNEDWRLFNEYIKNYQDFRTQLRGFLVNRIDLTRLKLSEVLEALNLIMTRFWNQAGIIHQTNPIYPFSQQFFMYLYEFHVHEYREILLHLQKIWDYYKSYTKVIELTDPFEMIRFIRIQMKTGGSASNTQIYQGQSDLYFSNLIEWEKEVIKNQFVNLDSRHVGSSQSYLVESKLAESLRILQEKEIPKQIHWAEQTPPISVETNRGKRTRKPDVYVELTRQDISDKKRTFEIQVKMYDENKYVKLKEIESSIELLERAHTDALLFLITGAGLDERAIEEINNKNLNDRVLYFKPLEEEQFRALAFLVYYEKITGQKPNVEVIKEILEIIFEKPWNSLIEEIRNIGSFRAQRIEEELERKKESGLEGSLGEKSKEQMQPEVPPRIAGWDDDITKPQSKITITPQSNESTDNSKITEVTGNESGELIQIIEKIGALEHKDLILTLYKRYHDNIKELKFILDCINKRSGRWANQATKAYLKKKVPAHLSDERVSGLFIRVRNEDTKDEVAENEKLFHYKGTSIHITDKAKIFYKFLLNLK